ncbi:MAG: ATP-dependent DNA helicase RecG [Bacteroidota bacterium]|nr:ATP-dependent DNA helicase RecG [Bacteroidota bacterium]
MKISKLKGISSNKLNALAKEGIHCAQDLLFFFPRRYLDRTNIQKIGQLQGIGEEVTVVGTISQINEQGFKAKKRLEIVVKDETGGIKAVWFKGAYYMKKRFTVGQKIALFGTVKQFGRHLSMAHPETDDISKESDLADFSTIVAIYPSGQHFHKARVHNSNIQQWIAQLLNHPSLRYLIPEFLPEYISSSYGFPNRTEAIRAIHNPSTHDSHKQALKRFKFEEFFLFQLSMERIHSERLAAKAGPSLTKNTPNTRHYFEHILPFKLTPGQKKALIDIQDDVRSGRQMNRLIQGDVGAGKTAVAMGALLMAVDNGFQGALVAPTEILAEQHYATLKEAFSQLDLSIRLLVGGQKVGLRRDVLTDIEGGGCDIVIGTHAVIQKEVRFHNLGMVVIDEQHRFGVQQRAALLHKANNPHMLVMSATPIPRSLAMSLYADLDISLIKGLPEGRKTIRTAIRSEKKRTDVYHFVEQEIKNGGQIYIIYPLIEESEALDLKDATAGYEKICERFPSVRVALLHGRIPSEEKDAIMQSFAKGEIDILVSTTVIEVGVNVPNASVMIIEHAERFGLSQLHQLRGRIGRGTRQSYCILMPDHAVSKSGAVRLKTMERTTDGFEIAEVDLKLRGPGDFLGTKQSGLPDFRFGDIIQDQDLLELAKKQARELMEQDFLLSKQEHLELKHFFESYHREKKLFYGLA